MDDELVLLTSYFNLTDGRRQDTAHTFRVDPSVPSATSPDGGAALYVVTESSASGHMGPRARRLVADTVGWEYSTHGDEPPAGRLKAALRTAHDEVLREFDGHVSVGCSVIAVEKDDIYLAQVAPAQVYVVHEGGLNSISASVGTTSPFSRALGAGSGPQISVFRDRIGPDDVLALCASWYHRAADANDLRECFEAGSADDIAGSLLDLAQDHDVRDATVIVIEAMRAADLEAATRDDNAPRFMDQVDNAVHALAEVGRMFWSELRAAPDHHGSNGSQADPQLQDLEPAASEPPTAAVELPRRARFREELTTENPILEADLLSADVPAVAPAVIDEPPAERPRPELETSAPRRSSVRAPRESIQAHTRARPAPADAEEPSTPREKNREQATDEIPAVPTASRRGVPLSEPPQVEDPASDTRLRRQRSPADAGRSAATPVERPRSEPAVPPVSELEQVNSRLQEGPDMAEVIPPVQTFPDTSTEPSRIYATSKEVDAANRRPRRFGGIARPAVRDPLAGPPVILPGNLGDVDLRESVRRPTLPTWVWGLLAIFCACLIAAVGYLAYKHRHPAVAANPYPAKAETRLKQARAATAPQSQDSFLALAQTDIKLAREHGTSPKRLRQLNHDWLVTHDLLHHIVRVTNPVVLSDFGKFPNAQPTQLAIAANLIFVLDSGRKSVFSITPNSTSNPALIVQAGEQYSGFTVGAPQQLAVDGSTALVLDDHNVLIRDADGVKTATSLTQQGQNQKLAAMTTSDPDVYLLDTASNQIWRYPNAVTGYSPPGAAYFVPPTTPDLTHAVSLAMDGASLYVLQANGGVLKYDYQANRQAFLVSLRLPLHHPVSIFTGPTLPSVWIADPPNGRIVQLTKTGQYVRTYVSASGMDLSQVRSFGVTSGGHLMYVLSGSKIYDFPVTP